jgi:hypothetical protein
MLNVRPDIAVSSGWFLWVIGEIFKIKIKAKMKEKMKEKKEDSYHRFLC